MRGRGVLNPKAVVKANVPTLTSVKQETATKLTATLAAPVEKVDLTDVALVRDDSHSVIAVKSVTVDTADATKLSIETYVSMTDGKSYTLTYTAQDEAKTQSTATFTATDGKIASFALSTATIPANKATTIKYSALDANGIVIYEKPINDKGDGIDIDVATDAGYLDVDGKLILLAVGNTAKVTVSYHTYNYDAQGNETGLIKNEFTVTAVDNSVTVSGAKYTIVDNPDTVPAWENLTVNTRLPMNETGYARFQVKDSNGDDITNDCDYTVESSNDNIVIASGEVKGAVTLVPVKEGSAYLVLKDKEKTVTTLAITVVKARELATFTLDTTSVAIANTAKEGANEAGVVAIGFTAKDQYGDDIEVDLGQDLKTYPNGYNKDSKKVKADMPDTASKGTIVITTDDALKGTYTYSLTATKGEVTRTRTFTVNVKTPAEDTKPSYALQFVKGADPAEVVVSGAATIKSTGALDTTVTKDTTDASVISVNLVEQKDGVITKSAENIKVTSITVKGSNGKTYAATGSGISAVSSTAISADVVKDVPGITGANGNLLKITAVSKDANSVYTKNLPAGSYTVILKFKVSDSDKSDRSVSSTFKVEDKQPTLTASVLKTSTDDTSILSVLGNKDYVKYVYGGVTQENESVSITAAYGKANGKTCVVSKATVAVKVGDNMVNIDVPINRVFTSTGEWTKELD